MANRSNINKRAKKHEREVQQYLWPGSKFAGGAKRPALEDEDLRGIDKNGDLWWGECKSKSKEAITVIGVWKILNDAFDQCLEATIRNEEKAKIFSVLRKKGTGIESSQNLVMIEISDIINSIKEYNEKIIMPLSKFKKIITEE